MKSFMTLFVYLTLIINTTVYAGQAPSETEPETKNVPIIMYHLVTKNPRVQGKFGISPAELESDLKYLKENGYETVVMADLIKFVDGRQSLPEKPIVLTFDDGWYSDCDYLVPMLEKYGMKAVLSIVGKFTDECSKEHSGKSPHMTWEQLAQISKVKAIELQSHSYSLHTDGGSGRRRGESEAEYKARLGKDLMSLQEKLTLTVGRAPSTFTYPFGIMSKGSDEILKELGFKASLSCREGNNVITRGQPDCLFRLRRNNRSAGRTVKQILEGLETQR